MSQDPEEAGIDWGYTGYGTGTPGSDWISKWMPWIVGGIMTAGGLQSLGVLPGGGAAVPASAGTTGPLATSVPGSYATTAYGAGNFGVPGGTAATVNAATNGLGTVLPATAKTIAGDATSSGLQKFLTNPQTYGGIAGLLTTLATRPKTGDQSAAFNQQYPQLNDLLNMASQRAERTDPLHQAVTQLAMNRLPTNVQR